MEISQNFVAFSEYMNFSRTEAYVWSDQSERFKVTIGKAQLSLSHSFWKEVLLIKEIDTTYDSHWRNKR